MASPRPISSQKNQSLPESVPGDPIPVQFTTETWFDDTCVLDIDLFIKTLTSIKAKGVRSDLIGSIISHHASKWLPELSGNEADVLSGRLEASPESAMATWIKKRFLVETLVGILPPERGSVPCSFLLRLLRVACMVGLDPACLVELESRVTWQLDQASLKELMIPAFSHTCGTLLDVELVLRLVRGFIGLDETIRSGAAAMAKVAKLVDSYLAEAALDANLTLSDFDALARVLPSHARATDDGLYRGIDTYLKAHPSTTKKERKTLCRLIDTRKLTPEALLHAAQNERLPVRTVIQVLFSEQAKLNRLTEFSGSFSGQRSPNPVHDVQARCPSKREAATQQQELHRLRENVARLQIQCQSMQAQIDRFVDQKKKKKGLLRWTSFLSRHSDVVEKIEEDEVGMTPMNGKKARLVKGMTTPPKWRNSLS